tara:strand:- start:794 stop:1585 length:792 start_codon:yes stop_codon:yes gene_type:complete
MEIIDQIFAKIYTLLDRAVDFLKHLTRLEIMFKLNEMSRKIHSSLIVLSIIFLTLLFIILSVVSKSGLYITYAVLSILGILILSYLSKDFHGACEGLISANKTTLRSNAILRFSAILTLLIAVITFLASLVSFFTGDIDLSLLLLLYTLLLYINAGTLFNPSLINISISSDSTSGEDFITIFSSGLKSFVYFERIISSLLILSGIFQIIEIIIDYNFYFSDMYMAAGLIAGGIAFPLIAYLLFTILWFVNSLLLAILSLKKSN